MEAAEVTKREQAEVSRARQQVHATAGVYHRKTEQGRREMFLRAEAAGGNLREPASAAERNRSLQYLQLQGSGRAEHR